MKTDIILAGVGGQGILTIAAIIGTAAIKKGWYLKQAETHGMSQRGGAVVSHLRIADRSVASDLIPLGQADVILSVEPMESLRYLPYLSFDGWLISSSNIFNNITDYPDFSIIKQEIEKISHSALLDADLIARETENPRGSNMVMLGAASPFLHLQEQELIWGIDNIFRSKGNEIVEANIRSFRAGADFSKKLLQTI